MSTSDNILLLTFLAVITLLIYLQSRGGRANQTVVCDYCYKRRRKIDCGKDLAGDYICPTCQEQKS
jgi:hypothetical protein